MPVGGSRTSESLRGEGEERGLAYLFAAGGAGRIAGAGFEPVELPHERHRGRAGGVAGVCAGEYRATRTWI